jgi:hypothetical protein
MKKKKRPANKFAARYPWGLWLGRRKTRIHKGSDYYYSTGIMAQMIRNRAHKTKVRISLEINYVDDWITISVISNHRG